MTMFRVRTRAKSRARVVLMVRVTARVTCYMARAPIRVCIVAKGRAVTARVDVWLGLGQSD